MTGKQLKKICKVCNTNRSRFSLLANWSLQVCDAINNYIESRWSVLMHDSESWFITLADRRRFDVSDMSCQRRLLRVLWQQCISNENIHKHTKKPTASYLLRNISLHIRRVYDMNPNKHGWKRPRGRPKTRLTDSIQHDLNNMLVSKPPMLPRWCVKEPSRRTLLAYRQRSIPSN